MSLKKLEPMSTPTGAVQVHEPPVPALAAEPPVPALPPPAWVAPPPPVPPLGSFAAQPDDEHADSKMTKKTAKAGRQPFQDRCMSIPRAVVPTALGQRELVADSRSKSK